MSMKYWNPERSTKCFGSQIKKNMDVMEKMWYIVTDENLNFS